MGHRNNMDGHRVDDRWRFKASGVFKPMDVSYLRLRNISGADSSRYRTMVLDFMRFIMGFANLGYRICQWIDTLSAPWRSPMVLYRQTCCEWPDYTCIRPRMVCGRNGV